MHIYETILKITIILQVVKKSYGGQGQESYFKTNWYRGVLVAILGRVSVQTVLVQAY